VKGHGTTSPDCARASCLTMRASQAARLARNKFVLSLRTGTHKRSAGLARAKLRLRGYDLVPTRIMKLAGEAPAPVEGLAPFRPALA